MESIKIPFFSSNLGRIDFVAQVMTADRKTFFDVDFKLDSGSDFTTLSCNDLYKLGYTRDFLRQCPYHKHPVTTASNTIHLQYLENISIKFEEREIQGCRIFFATETSMRSLFGSDILKYFNWSVNYDEGLFQMTKTTRTPQLSKEEQPLHIYDVGVI